MTRKGYSLDSIQTRVKNARWRILMAGLALFCFACLAFLMYKGSGT